MEFFSLKKTFKILMLNILEMRRPRGQVEDSVAGGRL